MNSIKVVKIKASDLKGETVVFLPSSVCKKDVEKIPFFTETEMTLVSPE